jgi:hypothetical protein
MNKRIIISLFLLVGLVGLAIFINFNRSVEAAYLGTTGLPEGSTNQTLRYNGDWEASSALLNDGTDITVSGDITATSFIYSSDVSLKEDVRLLDDALEKVIKLEGVSFTWKDSGEQEIGLIAQEVERVVPELVVTGNDDLKAVKYGNIVALLIEAVKEQQIEINSLKSELEEIK